MNGGYVDLVKGHLSEPKYTREPAFMTDMELSETVLLIGCRVV